MDTPPQQEATGHHYPPARTPSVPDEREQPTAAWPRSAALSSGRPQPEPEPGRGDLGLVPAQGDPGTRVDWAQCRIAARISAENSGLEAGHDLFGWYAVRLDDDHTIRASRPSGLKSLVGAAPPFTTWHAIAELRRTFPAGHIWRDGTSWHARRRGNFRQDYRPGAPLYAVHGVDAVELRGLLDEQTAGQ